MLILSSVSELTEQWYEFTVPLKHTGPVILCVLAAQQMPTSGRAKKLHQLHGDFQNTNIGYSGSLYCYLILSQVALQHYCK
jgi:hypothetical protein